MTQMGYTDGKNIFKYLIETDVLKSNLKIKDP